MLAVGGVGELWGCAGGPVERLERLEMLEILYHWAILRPDQLWPKYDMTKIEQAKYTRAFIHANIILAGV